MPFYSRYATTDENLQFQRKYGSTPYVAQTKWIADNAAALRIPFTIHLGDVVDQQGKPLQWQVADSAMKVLESAKIPYSILAGNHDVISDVDYIDASSQSANTDAPRSRTCRPWIELQRRLHRRSVPEDSRQLDGREQRVDEHHGARRPARRRQRHRPRRRRR